MSMIGSDLIVASAPCEESFLAPGSSVLIPASRINIERFSTFTLEVGRPAPSMQKILARIPRAKFFRSSLSVRHAGNDFLATTMATRKQSAFQVSWVPSGVRISLDKVLYAQRTEELMQSAAMSSR